MDVTLAVIMVVGALCVGAVIGWLVATVKGREQLSQSQAREAALAAKYESESLQHSRDMAAADTAHRQRVEELKAQMQNEREHAEELIKAASAMTVKLQATAAEQLAAKQTALQEHNRQQIAELMSPIKEQFVEFRKAVEESKTQGEVNKKELQSAFDATMRLFQQQQQQAVNALREQTDSIGSDAANLTKALKGDSKVQGDWGEMVLESMLEGSGLRKDEQYFIQQSTTDADGNRLRPDVVVRFPEGRSVVIDSKVSLTAYAQAVATDDEAARERLLKEHLRSVKAHIDELSRKKYDDVIDDAIGYVLMFMPIESSYIAAVKADPTITQYAYNKRIIVISPSNLMMSLQLAYNLWQYDKQGKNVENTIKLAADLYDKVAGFADTFAEIETGIEKLRQTYATAKNRLYEGSGNVMRRVEQLKKLGVMPKKQIKGVSDEPQQ